MAVGSQIPQLLAWKSSTSVEPVIGFIPKKEGALTTDYGSTIQECHESWQTLRSALAQKLNLAPTIPGSLP